MWGYLKVGGIVVLAATLLGAIVWAAGFWRSLDQIESQKVAQAKDGVEAKRLLQQALDQRKVLGPAGKFAVAFYDCDLYRLDTSQEWLPVALEFGADDTSVPTGCRNAEAHLAEEYLMATICEQAVGASGGCSRFGVFRSLDGIAWERRRTGPKGEFWLPANSQ